MSEKKLTIRNTPNEILEAIEKEHGIQIIKDFIKQKTKGQGKKGRPKNGTITGASVYFNMYGLDINDIESYKNFTEAQQEKIITNAKEEIANKNEILFGTVDKHVTAFNKRATGLNYDKFYMEFIKQVNNYNNDAINDFEDLKEFLTYYSVERQTHNQMTRIIEVIGDSRYFEVDIRIAIAMFLKFKYELAKNQFNIHAKHKEDEYMDMPF